MTTFKRKHSHRSIQLSTNTNPSGLAQWFSTRVILAPQRIFRNGYIFLTLITEGLRRIDAAETAFNTCVTAPQQRFTQPQMSIVMDWDSKFPGDSKIHLISEMQRRWIDGSQGGDGYYTRLCCCRIVWHFNQGTSSHQPVPPVCRMGFLLPSSMIWAAEGLVESLNR